jgi:hypothetical protein
MKQLLITPVKTARIACRTGLLHRGCTVFAMVMHYHCTANAWDIRPISGGIGDMEISHLQWSRFHRVTEMMPDD